MKSVAKVNQLNITRTGMAAYGAVIVLGAIGVFMAALSPDTLKQIDISPDWFYLKFCVFAIIFMAVANGISAILGFPFFVEPKEANEESKN